MPRLTLSLVTRSQPTRGSLAIGPTESSEDDSACDGNRVDWHSSLPYPRFQCCASITPSPINSKSFVRGKRKKESPEINQLHLPNPEATSHCLTQANIFPA